MLGVVVRDYWFIDITVDAVNVRSYNIIENFAVTHFTRIHLVNFKVLVNNYKLVGVVLSTGILLHVLP